MQVINVSILGTEYQIQKKAYKDEPAFEKRGVRSGGNRSESGI